MDVSSIDPSSMAALISVSRRFGADPAWLLAGGGNTSFKNGATLWIKASGKALGTIGADGFCPMDRSKLASMWTKDYPADSNARESAVLADLMAARLPGESGRPSVETLMHDLFPQAYVVHTHPGLVNGLTCGKGGKARALELFADEAIWVPYVDPGLVLARAVKDEVAGFRDRMGRYPAVMFMQNHGLLVAADSAAEIEILSTRVFAALESALVRTPDRSPVAVPISGFSETVARLNANAPAGSCIIHRSDTDILRFAASREAFAPLSSAFSPDHIVYAGHEFLYASSPGAVDESWKRYRERNGTDPRVAIVAGTGAFAIAATSSAAETAMAFLIDACAVAVYAESFGGTLHMDKERVEFIRTWEVERYRAKASLGAGESK